MAGKMTITKVGQSTAISDNGRDYIGGDGGGDDDDDDDNRDGGISSAVNSNDNNDTEQHHQHHVVKKLTEPGVINDALLKTVLYAHRPRGEAARLCRNIAIDYGTITELFLEYQNILKIDHIWMCFSLQKLSLKSNKLTKIENLDNLNELRELDLSFNFIEIIENLECLHRLEYLTLFQNHIRRIENIERLEHLTRLNLAKNFIETVDGIEDLRYKTQLFSLNLDQNPICDKLTDFRLYIAAYLPKLKYYGYRVITNAERDKGRKIYKNKLRMLEENESELAIERHEQSLDAEQQHISSESFVNDLDKHQLFESLFINNLDSNTLDTDNNDSKSGSIDICRNRIYVATQEMHLYGIQCFNHRTNEIKLFDAALANSFDEIQAISIELIDKFFGQKADFAMNLKLVIESLPTNSTDDNCAATHQTYIDTLCDNFERTVDNIWYRLIELETSQHERILESMNRFNDTIRTIIENFNDKCNETFMRIRSACTTYLQSNSDSPNEALKQYQISIINHQLDLMCTKANKWLSQTMERYELTEYNRNRVKIMEISDFIDAERCAFSQLKDNLIKQYEMQAYFLSSS